MRFAVPIAVVLLFWSSLASAQTRPAPPPASTPAGNQLELNSASRDALMTLDGIGEVRADAIIRARPFKAKTELVERRLIPEALYEKISDKVFARPPPPAPPPPKPAPAAPAKRG
jgi:DNA uptake protein ComE-like DNA-binding protein